MSTTIPARDTDIAVLDAVQRRVLWLATSIVHHANRVRRTPSGVKVGGHQASSASMVSIMTALYFHHLRAPDRVSVKPHAAPVLHAIEYLLGQLDRRHLTELRAFGGLQSYPSRLKDPVPADFSTGSVGIGATAPIWSRARAPLRRRPLRRPAGRPPGLARRRRGARRGRGLGGDRRPGRDAPRRGAVDRRPQPPVARPRRARHRRRAARRDVRGGGLAREHRQVRAPPRAPTRRCCDRITEMPNEEYQRLLRARPTPRTSARRLGDAAADIGDGDLRGIVRDLGGHDLGLLLDAFDAADAVTDRPSVIFAYTIKAWRLQTEGHPGNHSALLTVDAVGAARRRRSAPTRPTRGRRSSRARRRPSCAPRSPRGCAGRRSSCARSRRSRPTSAAGTPARSRPSRRSGASSSTSPTAPPTSPRTS